LILNQVKKKSLINSFQTQPNKLAGFRYQIKLKKKVLLIAIRPSQKYWQGLDTKFSYKKMFNKKLSDPAKYIGRV
jgi:hypothetical protein